MLKKKQNMKNQTKAGTNFSLKYEVDNPPQKNNSQTFFDKNTPPSSLSCHIWLPNCITRLPRPTRLTLFLISAVSTLVGGDAHFSRWSRRAIATLASTCCG